MTDTRVTTRRRTLFGNLFIILGVVLLGAAVGMVASGSVVSVTRATSASFQDSAESDVSTRWIPAIQAERAGNDTRPVDETLSTSSNSRSPAPVASGPTRTPDVPTTDEVEQPVTPPQPMPPAIHIDVPAVGIRTKVVEVGYDVVTLGEQKVIQWKVADFAAGHHALSANPGEGENIVITGHNDWRGAVFRTLEKARVGDLVILETNAREHRYAIAEIHYRREVGVSLEERLATGGFLVPMGEERLTLVTCWPYGVDDHRLIVVAKPFDDDARHDSQFDPPG